MSLLGIIETLRRNLKAVIVASCKPIADDDSDPPCIRAKREYVAIVDEAKGEFYCTGEYPSEKSVEPLVFTVTA